MKVLVAYDTSAPAQEAAEYAFRTYTDAELVLVRVIEAADGYTDATITLAQKAIADRKEAADEEMLAKLQSVAVSADVEFYTVVRVGNPAREVVAVAEEEAVDHIVVGNHGRTGASRVLLGSVAERIVRRAPVPVTVVR